MTDPNKQPWNDSPTPHAGDAGAAGAASVMADKGERGDASVPLPSAAVHANGGGGPLPLGAALAAASKTASGAASGAASPHEAQAEPVQPSSRPVNPGWGRAAGGAAPPPGSAGSGGGTPPPGGAWVWLPQGMEPRRPWRKRHPVLFWGGALLLLLAVFGWGRLSGDNSPFAGPKIAVIKVDGLILDADPIVAWIEKVGKDAAYKGAIVRINSPGGAVGPSQEIYAAVKRLARRKPVVASMGALAASGGYYAALGAQEIFAGPSTVTASIGVKMQIPNIEGLMRTIGISERTLATGRLKDAGSSWREMRPEEEAYLRGLLEDLYAEFIAVVADERGLPLDRVRELADGRAMTGRQALEAKLVDSLGDLNAAAQRLQQLAKLEGREVRLVEGPEKPVSLLTDMLTSTLETVLERQAALEQPVFMY